MKKLWRIWKYALGSFSDEKTKQYDNHIVLVRTSILFCYLITNGFIMAGVIRHWNKDRSEEWILTATQRVQSVKQNGMEENFIGQQVR